MLFDDILASQAIVSDLQTKLDLEKNKLAQLLAQQVAGGVDVSEFQGDIDWAKVKAAGYIFAITRVNDGDKEDARYNVGRTNAVRASGLILGGYSFARPANASNGNRDAAIECAMSLWLTWRGGGLRKGDLPLTYDFENESIANNNQLDCADHLIRWVKTYKYMRGHNPIVYTNRSTIEAVLPYLGSNERTLLANCPLWIADPSATIAPVVPEPWSSAGKGWLIWQQKAKSVPGVVTGPVDVNAFAGSKSDLDELLIK